MYGKLFTQMYDGTLATRGPWQALVTFQQMIILADSTGIIDMTAEAISRRTTVPLSIIEIGIAALEAPDAESRSPDLEGRRIVRLSEERAWGWHIVNHQHYRKLRSQEERREYMRKYQRERRAKQVNVNNDVNLVNDVNPSSKQYAVSNKNPKPFVRSATAPSAADTTFEAFWKAWPANPRKVGKSACKKKWQSGKLEEVSERLLAHVAAMAKTDQWREFCPAPLTYINQRRWEDGLETVTKMVKRVAL